jgi:oligopeptide/dipeptide ABC transporter ATP-binding protein
LALNPSLVVLDEPVSALDVSVRVQIMNLLKDLQLGHGLTYVLIAHNLATVRYMSHKIAVMYLGQIVEYGSCERVFDNPLHPYTKALISASSFVSPGEAEGCGGEIILKGEMPSPTNPPPGCRFHTRCEYSQEVCSLVAPGITFFADQWVRCHLYGHAKNL